MNDHLMKKIQQLIDVLVNALLIILVLTVVIMMIESVYILLREAIAFQTNDALYGFVKDIATIFILLEIIEMLWLYIKENHTIHVRFLILICMTAILRQVLLAHGSGLDTMFFAIAILILAVVYYFCSNIYKQDKKGLEE